MKGASRVFRKDLLELLLSWRGIALNLMLPPLLVLLVGQLRTQPVSFRLLVAGAPQENREKIAVLEDLSPLQVTVWDHPAVNPLAEIRNHRFDLVANFNDAKGPGWSLYTAETDAFRLRALRLMTSRVKEALDIISVDPSPERKDVRPLIGILANPAPQGLFAYFPQAEMQNSLTPEITALVVCFLPFMLAASTLVREREAHTIEVFLAAPGIRPSSLFAGKVLYPITAALIVFALCLVLVQTAYDLHVKAGFLVIALFLLSALLSATFMGLIVSALVSSHSQALAVSAAFFFGFTLLSGFLYPVSSDSSGFVFWLSRLFPLTFVHPVLKPWMYGGAPPQNWWLLWLWLLLQCAVYGATARLAFRSMMRRI